MSKFEELTEKLREIFQIDRPDLDFGIYRILNARAGEIDDYLSKRLKARVSEALASGAAANTETLKAAIDKAREAAIAAGYNPDEAPKVLSLQKELIAATTGTAEHENQVFSHLLTFFSRYYDKGDFISQRRYKGDTYAIPYAGEEVVLHWANKDQYYTKSGEAFSNYSFKLDDGRLVHFRLVAADTAKDNRKDNDKERCFVLAEPRTITRQDDDGEAYDETVEPVTDEGEALIIRFDYAAQPKGTKQDALMEKAAGSVLASEAVQARWLGLTTRAPTEKKPERTLLEKHLTTYSQKNSADYFIHKDLGGFLRRELDFYVKNEVMNLDDVQNADAFAAIEKNLRMIQTLRAIAQDVIVFLASIENFQKKLWLKRKFVVAAHYCMTLDRVPEALFARIAANLAQWAQWHDLGMRNDAKPGTIDDLKAAPFLMVDTALFDAAFRADLLKAIPDLDASMDGLLVHGDNFQALNLLQERYRGQVHAVITDPPYNTGGDDFAYKDSYLHSSWLTLLHQTTRHSLPMMFDKGIYFFHLGDKNNTFRESASFQKLLDNSIGDENYIAQLVWKNKSGGGNDSEFFAIDHEYIFVYAKNRKNAKIDLDLGAEVTTSYNRKDNFGAYSLERLDKQSIRYSISGDFEIIGPKGESYFPRHKDIKAPNATWRWSANTVKERFQELVFEGGNIYTKNYQKEGAIARSLLVDERFGRTRSGKTELFGLFSDSPFENPKPSKLEAHLARIAMNDGGIFLDYFAGSGTTAHAVIDLNRSVKTKNRFISIEVGWHFNTVLKPRIQKVVYSADWSEGKPTAPETGISHAFKVLKIESYEDTLNNLQLARAPAQTTLLDALPETARDEYLMHYMLDVEARGSLLSVADFQKPFDYSLKIAVDSAGAFDTRKVDLVETFNYLIGLTVRTIDIQIKQGFVAVEGNLPNGDKALVLWRDCEVLGYEALTNLCNKLKINPSDNEYDVVYINGDNNIPTSFTASEADGGLTRTLKLLQIESVFLDAMFNVDDV